MKTGADNRRQVILLVVLLVVAGVSLWWVLGPASPTLPAGAAVAATTRTEAPNLSLSRLDPRLNLDLLDRLRALDYKGDGRDLFHFGAAPAIVQNPLPGRGGRGPVAPVKPEPVVTPPPQPTGPPPPPPIPLKFYGFAQANGMPEKIFLSGSDDNYVVSQGDTVAKRYQILNIGKVSVRVKDLQTGSEQELPLQQGG